MNVIKTLMLAALFAALVWSAPQASADYMDFQGMGLNKTVFVQAPSRHAWTQAGQMQLNWNDDDSLGYCVDFYQFAGDGDVTAGGLEDLQGWNLGFDSPAYKTDRRAMVGYVFDTYAPQVTTGQQAAALQVSIWELLYETPSGKFDLGKGRFKIRFDRDVEAMGNAILDSLPGDYEPPMGPIVLTSPTRQDMIIHGGAPVPEPATASLLGLGGALLLLRRRRSR